MNLIKYLTSKPTRAHIEPFLKKYASNAHTLDLGADDSPYRALFPNRVSLDVEARPGVDVVGDAHALPFVDGEFEVILCTEVLEHLHDPARAISEMHRVLAPGGLFILTTRFLYPIHDAPGDFFRFTRYGLQHLLRDWEILELVEESGTQETIGILMHRIGLQARFFGGSFGKVAVLILGKIFMILPNLVRTEFADIEHSRTDRNIMTTGYYVAARRAE